MTKTILRRLLLISVVVAMLTMSTTSAHAALIKATNQHQYQQYSNWCWAASACSIIPNQSGSGGPSQSSFVQATLGNQNNVGATIIQVRYTMEFYYGVIGSIYAGSLSLSAIKSHINSNEPVYVAVMWSGGGGHAVVVSGYYDNNNDVYVMDPYYGWQITSYSNMVSNYLGSGSWSSCIRL